MIIGLTGSYGAGKDTVADYLVKKGFVYHSLSDLLREELMIRGQEISRENLIAIGNEIRKKFGGGELARRTLNKIKGDNEVWALVVSIRNPDEVKVLRGLENFILWFVDAPPKVRYDRTVKRGRSDDFSSYEDFVAKEKMENSADPGAQQLSKVAEMANRKIVNDGSLDDLYKKVDALVNES